MDKRRLAKWRRWREWKGLDRFRRPRPSKWSLPRYKARFGTPIPPLVCPRKAVGHSHRPAASRIQIPLWEKRRAPHGGVETLVRSAEDYSHSQANSRLGAMPE